MLNDKESPFTLTLTDSGLRLPVVRFRGEEALNQPYRFDIELLGLAPAIVPGSFLHRPAFCGSVSSTDSTASFPAPAANIAGRIGSAID